MSEIPNILQFSVIGSLIYYFSIKLNTDDASKYFIHVGYHILLVWTATGLGSIGGALVKDKNIGVALIPVFLIPFMLLAGFFVNQDNIVEVLIPFEYISPFKYGFQVFALNEYEGLHLSCMPDCDPIKSFGFEQTLEESVIITAALGVAFYSIAYFVLFILSRRAK